MDKIATDYQTLVATGRFPLGFFEEKIVKNGIHRPSEGPSFPLFQAADGDRVRIVALRAGRSLGRRLADLGLPVGSEIEIVSRHGGGRMIVARDLVRVALGAGMAQKILVSKLAKSA